MTRVPGGNPYVGLRPFQTEDSRYFFGRDEQVGELLEILHEHRFLPIVGGSGSGKSSLVRAGLIPMLRAGFLVGTRDHWIVATLRPGAAPFRNFAEALARAFDSEAGDDAIGTLEQELRLTQAEAALDFVEERLKGNQSVLILVDQFEELFHFRGTTHDDDDASSAAARERAARRAEAADFVDMLRGVGKRPELPVFVVFTMRSDFLGDCDVFLDLPEAMNKARYLVPRLTREQLRQAIEGPALMRDVEVSARLVDRLLNELGDRNDRLPVLQHALQRTWDYWVADKERGMIDMPHLKSAGGLENALNNDATIALGSVNARHAELVFRALTDTDVQQRRVRRPRRLSEVAGDTGLTREQVKGVIDAFCGDERNFLFLSPDGNEDDPRVDLSHESLIRQWPLLAKWIDDEASARDDFLALGRSAMDWQGNKRDVLWGRELEVQSERWKNLLGKGIPANATWAARYSEGENLFAAIAEFLKASERAAQEAKQRQRARANVRRALQISIPLFVLAVLGLWKWDSDRKADEVYRKTREALLKASIRDLADVDPTTAAALVGQIPDSTEFSWSEVEALRKIADADVAKIVEEGIVTVAASEVGSRFAMLRGDGDILLWPSADSAQPRRIKSGASGVLHLALDSAGKVAVVTDSTGAIRVVGMNDGSSHSLVGSSLAASYFAFGPVLEPRITPDGSLVLGRCDGLKPSPEDPSYIENAFCVWRTSGDASPLHRIGESGDCIPEAADIHRSGSMLVMGCGQGLIESWDLRNARTRATKLYNVSSDESFTSVIVRFSPDGRRAAFVVDSGIVIWTVASGKTRLLSKAGFSEEVSAIQFDHAGRRLVASTFDSVAVWDSLDLPRRGSAAQPPRMYGGGNSELIDASISPDGEWIVSSHTDGTARMWRARDTTEVRLLRGHSTAVSQSVFTGDMAYMATIADDSSARVWSMVHDPEPFVWHAPDSLQSVALNSGATELAVVTRSGALLAQPLTIDGSSAFKLAAPPVALYEPRPRMPVALDRTLVNAYPVDTRFHGDTLLALIREDTVFRLRRLRPGSRTPPHIWQDVQTLLGGQRRVQWNWAAATVVAVDDSGTHVWKNGVAQRPHRHGTIGMGDADTVDRQVQLSGDGKIARSLVVIRRRRAPGEPSPGARSGSRSIHFWDTSTGKDVVTNPMSTSNTDQRSSLSSGGDSVAAVRNSREIRIRSGIRKIEGNDRRLGYTRAPIATFTFSDSGDKLAAADTVGGISLWAPGRRAGSLDLRSMRGGTPVALTFSSDGKRVVSAHRDGAVQIWTIDPELLIKRITSYSRACVPERVSMERLRMGKEEARQELKSCRDRQAAAR